MENNFLLSTFLSDLWANGAVEVDKVEPPFAEADRQYACELLQAFYEEDQLHIPLWAPAFSPEAALWAAEILYRATQLTLVREWGEKEILTLLPDFIGPVNPATIYSADLSLRYLPDLLQLAQGLAPDDPLVLRLKTILFHWPFSAVGLKWEELPDPSAVLAEEALRIAYLNRITQQKDRKLALHPQIQPFILAALGAHGKALWPEFTPTES